MDDWRRQVSEVKKNPDMMRMPRKRADERSTVRADETNGLRQEQDLQFVEMDVWLKRPGNKNKTPVDGWKWHDVVSRWLASFQTGILGACR